MDGAIFFRFSACSSLFGFHLADCVSGFVIPRRLGRFFSFALPPHAGSLLLAGLNQSPAPGRGMCGRVISLRLRAGWRFACFYRVVSLSRLRSFAIVSPAVRVFISRLALLTRFAVGSCFACVEPRSLFVPRVPRPVRFLLRACFPPRLIRRVRFNRRPLRLVLSALLVSCPRFAVPRSVPPRRSSPRLSVYLLRPSLFRGGLVAILPRFAHLPALLVVERGDGCGGYGLLCRGFLSSRAARCLEFRFSVSLVHRGLIVSPHVRPLPAVLAYLSRLGSSRALAALVPRACVLLALDMRIAPSLISYRGAERYFPFRLFFLVRFYSSMMA